MKQNNKIQPAPRLRKKNGVWVKVLVPVLCVVAGAGAMAGLTAGVPAVGNMFVKQNTQVKPGTSTSNNSELQTQINELKVKLEDANNLASTRLIKINELTTQIETNKTEKQTLLNQIETIKNNAELSDTQKQEQINTLNTQIETLETTNTTLTAQLNQAKVDKEQAESVVAGLQAQIAELQAKVDRFEGNAIVDTLKLENFEGTWYKSGTFEDYFVIKDQVITRGANVDKGVVYRLDNQVYFGLNSLNNTAVTLSENGTKITLADGTEYKNSYVNTLENTTINMAWLSGEYSHGETKIVLNSDNTASYFDGTQTKYGAFTATATKKNVGGNITITHYITLTLNDSDETQTTMNLTMIGNGDLTCNDVNYTKTMIENCFGYAANLKDNEKQDTYKITVKFKDKITYNSMLPKLVVWANGYADNAIKINNRSSSYNSTYSFLMGDMNAGEDIEYLTFYVKIIDETKIKEPIKFAFMKANSTAINNNTIVGAPIFSIVNIEKIGNPKSVDFANYTYGNFISVNYITCDPIADYYTGAWSNENISLNLTDTAATVTTTGSEAVEATECTVTARTDGTNIYHDLTIKYIDAEGTEHVLNYTVKNNATSAETATLDGQATTLTKA